MSWFYRNALRPVLFTQDAESIHNRTMAMLNWVGRNELVSDAMRSFLGAPELPIELFGLRFPNPVGLAAGMDKNAEALPAWAAMGFGFTELGAATWQAQPGNPPPRVFRAIAEEAIVNRMGFNNLGAEAIAEKLRLEEARPLARASRGHESRQIKDYSAGPGRGGLRQFLSRAAAVPGFFRRERQLPEHAEFAPTPGQERAG
jgi:hypothetical protein